MSDAFAEEIARIRQHYEWRDASIPKERDSYLGARNLFIFQNQERALGSLLERNGLLPLAHRRIVELGCGSGVWLRRLILYGARPEKLFGIDLMPDRVERARETCPSAVTIVCGNAAHVPYAAGSFDIVLQSLLFGSVLDGGLRLAIASEMQRIVRPGGVILWYDLRVNNPRNRNTRRVTAANLRELFPDSEMDLIRVTLAPPLADRLAVVSTIACEALSRIPLLCTHLLGVIKPRRSAAAS
jgi:SAM-dependent methyltransferase